MSLAFDSEDNLWVAFETKPLVRKYTRDWVLVLETELSAPEIDRARKQDRPQAQPRTYVIYFTDVMCRGAGTVFLAGHNYVYELGPSGQLVREYVVDFPRAREQTRYWFINRFTYDTKRKSFYAVSAIDGLVFRF